MRIASALCCPHFDGRGLDFRTSAGCFLCTKVQGPPIHSLKGLVHLGAYDSPRVSGIRYQWTHVLRASEHEH